jgi:hypothetical protein
MENSEKMLCQKKVVEVKAVVELELQQRGALIRSRDTNNQTDGFYVVTAAEIEAESKQNQSSQTRAQTSTVSTRAKPVNSSASSDRKVLKEGKPNNLVIKTDETTKGVAVRVLMHISCRSDTYKSGHDYAGLRPVRMGNCKRNSL